MMIRLLKYFLLMLILGLASFPPFSFGSNEVDRSERLGLLRQATGGTPVGTTGSFQERLDSILNRDPEPQRTYIANQDAEIRAEALNTQLADEEAALKKAALPAFNTEDPTAESQTGMIKPDLQANKILADEKTFSELQEKETRESKTKTEEDEVPEPAQPEQTEQTADPNAIMPSLANNPFYFGPQNDKSFDDDKPIIISRLMQRLNYTELEAKNLVSTASSAEELILFLMQNESFEYGEAAEIVKTSQAEK